jgi:hypothetical protein
MFLDIICKVKFHIYYSAEGCVDYGIERVIL